MKEGNSSATASALTLGAALALAMLAPPEVYEESGASIALLLALGFLVSRPATRAAVWMVGAGLFAANLFVSLAPGRTVSWLPYFGIVFAAFVLARSLGAARRESLHLLMAACGAALGFYALAQRFFLLERDAQIARESGAMPLLLARLETSRPFATHMVPASLAGVLVLAACALLIWAEKRRARDTMAWRKERWLVAALALPIAAGFLVTGSLGGWAGLAAAVLVVLRPRLGARSRRGVLAGLVGLVLVAAVLIALRPVSVFDFQDPDNPLVLRAGNWRAAVLTAAEGGPLGTGLGSFGSLYPSVRRLEDNETHFVHNSWLQLTVEGGLPFGLLLIWGAVILWRRVSSENGWQACLALAAPVAFAVHNLVDFTAYLPGVALPAAVLTGFAFSTSARDRSQTLGTPLGLRLAIVAMLILFAAFFAGEFLAKSEIRRFSTEISEIDDDEVVRRMSAASFGARWNPRTMTHLVRATMGREAGPGRPQPRTRAWVDRLTAMDPLSPVPWELLGDLALIEGRPAEAWLHYRHALARYPVDEEVAQKIAGLQEALERRGFLEEAAENYEAQPMARDFVWESWDDLLLIIAVAMISALFWQRRRSTGAPAEALGLALLLLLAPWGEGGALPGVRFGLALVITVTLALFLWRDRKDHTALAVPRPVISLIGAVLVVAAMAAFFSPAPADARDGFSTLFLALAAMALSAALGARHAGWLEIIVGVTGLAASLAGLLWLLQIMAPWLGIDLSNAPAPFFVPAGGRPVGDFLHPGHLSTFIVACAFVLLASGMATPVRRFRLAHAALLLLLGTAGIGAMGFRRGTFVALIAGALALAAISRSRRVRRAALAVIAVGVMVGLPLLAWRFWGGEAHSGTRFAIWQACLEASWMRPLQGFGPGAFDAVSTHFSLSHPQEWVRYGRVFRGPHSDAIQAILALGWPGGFLAIGAFAYCWLRAGRYARQGHAVVAGLLAAVAATGAHALFDDLYSERPALALFTAVWLGAAVGRALHERVGRSVSAPVRRGLLASAVILLIWAEGMPWAAERLDREAMPKAATRVDSLRSKFWFHRARRDAGGMLTPVDRVGTSIARGVWLESGTASAHAERAQWLESLCRGPLPERGICRAAADAWSAQLALRPHDALARFRRALLWKHLGQPASLEADLALLIAWEPHFLPARLEMISLMVEQRRSASARSELAEFDETVLSLRGWRPSNRLEQSFLAVSTARIDRLRAEVGRSSP